MSELSHFDASGSSRMVDVSSKDVTERFARSEGFVSMAPDTLRLVRDSQVVKGDVLEVARLAGIMATKHTADLIPLCHPLGLDSASIDFAFIKDTTIRIDSSVRVHSRTGVEMESLTAVSVAALTIYDMCKSVDRGIEIGPIRLVEKSGGNSGHYQRLS